MKNFAAIKFIGLIGLILCAAIAVRAFAAGKQKTTAQFTVKIFPRVAVSAKSADEFYDKLKSNGLDESSTCMNWQSDTEQKSWCTAMGKKSTRAVSGSPRPSGSPSGPPNVQQRIQFTSAAGVKALADMLVTTSANTTPPPPPPHVQQTAGLDSQQEKRVAEALRR